MKAVNLLPQTQRRAPGASGAKKPLAIAGAVVALGAMGYWGYSVNGQVDQAKQDVAAASAERDALQAQLGAFQQAQARDAAQSVRRGAVVGLVAGRVNWERLVRDLSAVMPRQVWLTNLKGETDPASALPVTGAPAAPNVGVSTIPRGIHLDGYAFTQSQVALLMARAATVPGLGEPRLASSEVQQEGARTVIHFVIDIPIDQRAQDRPTLTPVSAAPAGATSGVTP
jgi:Tfp pilus assembly protein PilN